MAGVWFWAPDPGLRTLCAPLREPLLLIYNLVLGNLRETSERKEDTIMTFGKRISYAFRCFFSLLFHGEIPADIAADTLKPPISPEIEKPMESSDRAVQMLSLLQRDGRLIDFLTEDMTPYPDNQLGAAVRSLHQSCREVLNRYLKLEPIMDANEDQPVTLPAGFDPASIKVIGNVTGQPPLQGLLRHRGWRATQVRLPSLPEGTGRSVVAPAEVEIP